MAEMAETEKVDVDNAEFAECRPKGATEESSSAKDGRRVVAFGRGASLKPRCVGGFGVVEPMDGSLWTVDFGRN